MTKTYDMQFIRYINLFGKITRVEAKHCFVYNNMLVFIVSARDVNRALGRNNENLKRLSDILGKRTRIVAEPKKASDLNGFVKLIVYPTVFERVEILNSIDEKGEISGKEVVITGGNRENKAMLIGRNRAREAELQEVLKQYFGVKGLRIA